MEGGNATEEEKHTSVLNSHLVTAFSFACAGPTSFSMYNKAVKNCISLIYSCDSLHSSIPVGITPYLQCKRLTWYYTM